VWARHKNAANANIIDYLPLERQAANLLFTALG
jgi:hypothetical protein